MMTSLWIGNLLDNHITIKTNSSLESWYQCRNWALGDFEFANKWFQFKLLRTTSHTRLRACDHYTSSILIGGKGGAGPSSLHSTLEGPTQYMNARWM